MPASRRIFIVFACVGLLLVVSYLATLSQLDISHATLSRISDSGSSRESQSQEAQIEAESSSPEHSRKISDTSTTDSESSKKTSDPPKVTLPSEKSTSKRPKVISKPEEAPESEKRKCRLTTVSMLYGSHRYSQLVGALETHRRHNERWGCEFRLLENAVTTREMYSKQYWVLTTMVEELAKPEDERQQWIMWVDADSMAINPALSPEAFLPPENLNLTGVYALVTADHNGLNAGIFYVRVHPSALDLMARTVAYPSTYPDEDLGWFGEQAAMANIIQELEEQSKLKSEPSGIAWMPKKWWNAYHTDEGFEGVPGHMLVHFAGLGATRLGHMQHWLEELSTNQEKWAVEADKLSYKDEITQYWTDYAANLTAQS